MDPASGMENATASGTACGGGACVSHTALDGARAAHRLHRHPHPRHHQGNAGRIAITEEHRGWIATDRQPSLRSDERSSSPESAFTIRGISVQLQRNTQHVLGVREGTTENSAVAGALLSDLVDRGLDTQRPLLCVIDGGTALRKAIRHLFGTHGVVHRYQVHKLRNVLEHLPEELRPSVRHAMRAAYDPATSAPSAQRQLERLARSLEQDHPGAAASVREGLDETLTLQKLGITGALWKTLRSTNPIEN